MKNFASIRVIGLSPRSKVALWNANVPAVVLPGVNEKPHTGNYNAFAE